MDNRCVHDGAGGDANAFGLQIAVHRHQHLAAQIVRFQQMAEAKDRRLVRRGGHTQIDSGKAAQHGRLIEGFFHARV